MVPLPLSIYLQAVLYGGAPDSVSRAAWTREPREGCKSQTRGGSALAPWALIPPVSPRPHDTARTESAMEPTALLTLLVIGGFIWGGLLILLYTAVRKERFKGGSE